MNLTNYYSSKKRSFIRKIKHAKYVSFDIFDTLLLRPFMRPTDLFLYIEKKYLLSGFAKCRINSEKLARVSTKKNDINLDNIYEKMPIKFKKIKDIEVATEIELTYCNNYIFDLIKICNKFDKNVLFLSDMYLDKNVLEKILKEKGITVKFEVYVSSDENATKSSGDLFKNVLKYKNISPSELVHIGDNYYSDFKVPKSIGIKSIFIMSYKDILLRSNPYIDSFYEKHIDDLGCSILLGLVAPRFCLDKIDENTYFYSLGYIFSGPFLYSFCKWINDEAIKDKVDKILFVARDGYTLSKIYSALNDKIDNQYVYAARTFKTLFYLEYESKGCDIIQEKSALDYILNYYKDKNEYLQKNTPPANSDYKTKKKFVKNNIKTYENLANIESKDYSNYINSVISDKTNIAVVDSVTTQFSSQSLLEKAGNIITQGYYLCLNDNSYKFKCNFKVKNFHDFRNRVYFNNWFIMEFFMTSPEPAIINFKNNHPVYATPNKFDLYKAKIYPYLSNGSIDYSKNAIKIFGHNPAFLVRSDILVEWVNCFVDNPSYLDKKMMKKIFLSHDSAGKYYMNVCSSWFQGNFKSKIKYFIKQINNKYYFYTKKRLFYKKCIGSFNYYYIWKICLYKKKNNI